MPAELPQQPTADRARELPKLAVAWWPWSVLGPHGVGNRWSSAGTSGQRRQISIASQRAFTVSTSDGEAARRWVRIPPPDPKAAQVGDRAGRLRVGSAARSLSWHTA
jgi:hypothetical protein